MRRFAKLLAALYVVLGFGVVADTNVRENCSPHCSETTAQNSDTRIEVDTKRIETASGVTIKITTKTYVNGKLVDSTQVVIHLKNYLN